MEETFKIEVEITVTENSQSKIQINQVSEQDLSPDMIAMVLAGGLALAIRLSDNEAVTMKDVVDYLNGEFIDPNSFMDARIVKP
jgi:hypothetical protein